MNHEKWMRKSWASLAKSDARETRMSPETFEIISSCATLLTALAALLTILEMRRQRITSYKPELVVFPPHLVFAHSTAYPDFPAVAWRRRDSTPESLGKTATLVDCANIGLGTAYDLHAKWHFDPEELVGLAAPLLESRGFSVCVEPNGSQITFQDNQLRESTHFLHALNEVSAPFVLPTSVSQPPFGIALPLVYLQTIALSLHAMALHPLEGHHAADYPEFPPLSLTVTYRDVGCGRGKNTFTISFELFAWGFKAAADGTQCLGEAVVLARVESHRKRPVA